MSYTDPWAWEIADVERLQKPIDIPGWVAQGSVQWLTRERWQRWEAAQSGKAVPAKDAEVKRVRRKPKKARDFHGSS